MNKVSEKVKKVAEMHALSNVELAEIAHVSKSTISKWFNTDTEPRSSAIKGISTALNIPVRYFYDDDYHYNFRKFDAPVYDCAAGEGRVNGEYATEHVSKEASEDYSYIRIHGDSMLPKVQDGDLIKVHHQTETTPSDLTVIKVNGETATLKYVEVTDTGIWVRASNKDVFEDRFFSVKEVLTLPVTIIGKAVELTRSL